MPRGKPAGVYVQLLLPPTPSSPANAPPPMIEFPVCCARRSVGSDELDSDTNNSATPLPQPPPLPLPSKRGFATHIYHDVMRERLQSLSTRQRQAVPMTYMEPNALMLLEFDERCCYGADDSTSTTEPREVLTRTSTTEPREVLTRTATLDGRVSVTWSEVVLDEMTRRVLAAQEAGALAVLVVLDVLGADAFELDISADAGVYIPVFMVSKTTLASRVAMDARQQQGTAPALETESPRVVPTFGDVLRDFLASQALPEDDDDTEKDPRAVPALPLAWVARCFRRVDTTAVRVDSAIAHGARGVVFVQDEQSLEVDGETLGAPDLSLSSTAVVAAVSTAAQRSLDWDGLGR
ncbi:hypothetical protein PINS_up004796 [Pythium insidiosum]|nr:hypothetical protein PINS_up004796 [Pythium insidiosum]